MEHKGYNTAVMPIGSDKAQQYKFQEQERQDELGLNWDSFKWRNYDYAIGRFFNIDPLAEDYAYQSPYNFAENKVIDHLELEGLEGVHHTMIDAAGNKSHKIEKNVIFLRQSPIQAKEGMTEKQIRRVNAKNAARISQDNARIGEIKEELSSFYGGVRKNSNGESVTFQFNFSELKVNDTDASGSDVLGGQTVHQIAAANGIEVANGDIVPATVFTTDSNIGSAEGKSAGSKVFGKSRTAPWGTWAHEMLHTLNVPDNGYNSGGILNSPPESITPKEVDNIIDESKEAK